MKNIKKELMTASISIVAFLFMYIFFVIIFGETVQYSSLSFGLIVLAIQIPLNTAILVYCKRYAGSSSRILNAIINGAFKEGMPKATGFCLYLLLFKESTNPLTLILGIVAMMLIEVLTQYYIILRPKKSASGFDN